MFDFVFRRSVVARSTALPLSRFFIIAVLGGWQSIPTRTLLRPYDKITDRIRRIGTDIFFQISRNSKAVTRKRENCSKHWLLLKPKCRCFSNFQRFSLNAKPLMPLRFSVDTVTNDDSLFVGIHHTMHTTKRNPDSIDDAFVCFNGLPISWQNI